MDFEVMFTYSFNWEKSVFIIFLEKKLDEIALVPSGK